MVIQGAGRPSLVTSPRSEVASLRRKAATANISNTQTFPKLRLKSGSTPTLPLTILKTTRIVLKKLYTFIKKIVDVEWVKEYQEAYGIEPSSRTGKEMILPDSPSAKRVNNMYAWSNVLSQILERIDGDSEAAIREDRALRRAAFAARDLCTFFYSDAGREVCEVEMEKVMRFEVC